MNESRGVSSSPRRFVKQRIRVKLSLGVHCRVRFQRVCVILEEKLLAHMVRSYERAYTS